MKVLWASNAPFVASGYGNQTELFTRRLKDAGHQVVIVGTFGHHGARMNNGGISILGGGHDQYGNDVLEADVEALAPDVAVLLYDAWVMRPEVLRHFACWSPVDHEPMPPLVRERLAGAKFTWAMSRFGEREMRKAGLDPFYVPHGVDTGVYTPMARDTARRVWTVDDDRFLAVMVAANKGTPVRKSFDRVLKAWAPFAREHAAARPLLYIHAFSNEIHGGIDLLACAEFYGAPPDTLKLADPYALLRGRYGAAEMNALYNAADVLVAPSMGEGFGIPVIEAQAAGCPVIVSDFTAQSELAGPGWKVPIGDDDRVWTPYDSEWCAPRPSEIRKGLEWALELRGDVALRAASRDFALDYDADRVFEQFLHPAVLACGGQLPARAKPIHQHTWGVVGVWDADESGEHWICLPCTDPDCPAELRVNRADERVIVPDGFAMEIDGTPLDIEDDPDGAVAKIVWREIENSYHLSGLTFSPGDVALDIGAHVGVVSIWLAKTHPGLRVIAYEPMPDNFARLRRNLQANGVTTVEAVNMAVTGDGRDLVIGAAEHNSGGHSAFTHVNGNGVTVPSRTLAQILEAHGVERVALLKIDCEGAEYEILTSPTAPLDRIERLRGELHTNAALRDAGHDPDALRALLAAAEIDTEAHVCPIA